MGWKDWQDKNKFAFIFSIIFVVIAILNTLSGLSGDAMGTPSLNSSVSSIFLGYGIIWVILGGLTMILTGSDAFADKYIIVLMVLSVILFWPVYFYIGRFVHWIYGKIKNRN